MFKIIKWIVILVVLAVVALLLWWNGVFGTPAASQPAAVINSSGSTGFDQTNRDIANIDVQLKVVSDEFALLGQTPSQTKILSVIH